MYTLRRISAAVPLKRYWQMGRNSSLVIIVTTPSADSKPLLSRLLLKHSEASRRLRDVRGLAGFQCWENSTRITSPPSICIRASGVSMFPIRV